MSFEHPTANNAADEPSASTSSTQSRKNRPSSAPLPQTPSATRLPIKWRDPITSAIMTAMTVLIAFFITGTSRISFAGATSWFEWGEVLVPNRITVLVLSLVAVVFTVLIWRAALARRTPSGWYLVAVGIALVAAFVLWTVADKPHSLMPVVDLLAGGLTFAVPLIFGSLSGVMCERSGVINIAIEGQLLFGAFAGSLVGSAFDSPYLGLIGAPIAGALVGVLLAWFTITFRADHIIVGVVLNMLVLGLTSFFYSTLLRPNIETLGRAVRLNTIPIPVLSDIPIIGPILFDQTLLVYLAYAAIAVIHIGLFHTRWGLRTRACGEHPRAADTVGINVNRIRWMNVILAGAVAGLGGAFFTVGQGLAFSKNMSAGNGFIALAAMIIGRWNPLGALAAALLFGFTTNLGSIMQIVGAPVPTEVLLMLPYLVTILAVAGFVGTVRPPAAEGKPYP